MRFVFALIIRCVLPSATLSNTADLLMAIAAVLTSSRCVVRVSPDGGANDVDRAMTAATVGLPFSTC
jgi:hypothetical protein